MKVSELEGAELDYWVGQAELKRLNIFPFVGINSVKEFCISDGRCIRNCEDGSTVDYSPSTDWSQGGPIIEREGLAVEPFRNQREHPKPYKYKWQSYYPAKSHTSGWYSENLQYGDTPLIAAMRCWVMKKFGETVKPCDSAVSKAPGK